MPTGKNDWIEIARTGRFTDMSGREVEITRSALERLASTDLAASPAPLVIGHPKTNAPAYGWVDGLKVAGEKLLARFRQVPEQVKELVRQDRYKRVSMSASGKLDRLVHVGLLGAAAPAIDGLAPVEMATGEDQVTIELSEPDPGTPGAATKEAQMPEETKELEQLRQELAERDKGLAQAREELDKERKEFAAFREEKVREGREARVESLMKEGKILPRDKDEILGFARALAGSEETFEFALGDGRSEKVSAEEKFWRNLEGRKHNHTGLFCEFATRAAAEGQESDEPSGGNLAAKF